jgi:predicted dinucleotide-binding enzyme
VLVAGYHSGATATVTVELSGCRTVTRGRVARSAEISPGGPALLARLVRLTS